MVPLPRMLVLLVVVAAACSTTDGIPRSDEVGGVSTAESSSAGEQLQVRTAEPAEIALITHGRTSDPYWRVVRRGAEDGAASLNLSLTFSAPDSDDAAAMAQLVDEAVAAGPDGLVLSVPDQSILGPSLKAAVASGLPIITINQGASASREIGALAHIGQDPSQVGEGTGEWLAADGVTNVLCLEPVSIDDTGSAHCAGLTTALAAGGGTTATMAVPDDSGVFVAALADRVVEEEGLAGVIAPNPAAVPLVLEALDRVERSDLQVVVFGLDDEVLDLIRQQRVNLAVDDQQYLQGYLSVVLLDRYLATGLAPGAGTLVASGPGFVTSENVDAVINSRREGLR